jgi:hypothetical protein
MGNFGTIKTKVSDVTGKPNDNDAYARQHEAGINWAKNDIEQRELSYLRVRSHINVTANKLIYNLATDYNNIDKLFICKTANIVGSVTEWTLDTSDDKTGHVDAALDSDVVAGSIITIDYVDYVIQSVTGDGTSADGIELDYAASTGTVIYLSGRNTKNVDRLKKAEYLDDILNYPASSTKNAPEKYIVSGTATSGSTTYQTINVGVPSSDNSYLLLYDYYKSTDDMDDDDDVCLLSHVYREDTPLVYGAVKYCYLNFWHEDHLVPFITLYDQEKAKVINKLARKTSDDFSG